MPKLVVLSDSDAETQAQPVAQAEPSLSEAVSTPPLACEETDVPPSSEDEIDADEGDGLATASADLAAIADLREEVRSLRMQHKRHCAELEASKNELVEGLRSQWAQTKTELVRHVRKMRKIVSARST